MCVTICGRFRPDEGAVAGYGNRIRVKYTAKWGVQIAGMIFQTGSSSSKVYFLLCTMSDKSRSRFFHLIVFFKKFHHLMLIQFRICIGTAQMPSSRYDHQFLLCPAEHIVLKRVIGIYIGVLLSMEKENRSFIFFMASVVSASFI